MDVPENGPVVARAVDELFRNSLAETLTEDDTQKKKKEDSSSSGKDTPDPILELNPMGG